MESRVIYRPSVCRQTADTHIHYSLVLVESPLPDIPNKHLLRRLASKVGGQTAGQVIQNLLEKRDIGFDINQYGVDYIKIESLPSFQVCHKGEVESPSVDWDAPLFTAAVVYPPIPLANAKVARIRHR